MRKKSFLKLLLLFLLKEILEISIKLTHCLEKILEQITED